MRKKSILALVLVAAMLLTGCQSILDLAMGNLMGEDWENYTMPFGEMVYERPDMEALDLQWQALERVSRDATSPQEIYDSAETFFGVLNDFETMYVLANIRYAQDLTDSYYKEEYDFCAQNLPTISSYAEKALVAMGASPLAQELEQEQYFGEGYFDDYQAPEGSGDDWQYESVWDEEFSRLNQQEESLINDFFAAQEELSDLDPNSDDYYTQCMEKTGPIFLELIALRQQIAAYVGYNSYEVFANEWYYNRSYTASDLDRYTQDVQTHLVPLYRQYQGEGKWDQFLEKSVDQGDCLAYVRSAADNMGGIVAEAFQEMQTRQLYDLKPGANKAAGSFETYLTSFAAPFILVNPTGTMDDLSVFAHEFGHFTNDYAAYGTYASSDVAEVLSQAMDYLCLQYADSLEPQDQEQMREYVMTASLSTYVEQLALYTFERRAYELTGEDLTVENLCALYDQVAQEFGFEARGWDRAEWSMLHHFFQAPFYVYSYVVSNDGAMQIYQLELQEKGAGLELYQQWAPMWEDLPLTEYLEQFGLTDPMAQGRAETLAQMFREILE